MSHILVVDDEPSMREFVSILLRRNNHEVTIASTGAAAILALADSNFDLVLTDLRMPDMSGLDVLEAVKKRQPEAEVILMTAFASTETAVEAMKRGARDYITKPFKVDELLVQIDKALEVSALHRENVQLRSELANRPSIIARSEAMKSVLSMVDRVARSRTTVLVTGESGTGKEVIARAIHDRSPRAAQAFVPVNCGAIPEMLIESELFGHVKGAFTGASTDREGIFASADGGTIFLDEIGELPQSMQVKLLRVLQERKLKRVGASHEQEVDARVVAATNRDLKEMVANGEFREDLYYRLNVIQLSVPPLRARPADVPPLVHHFVNRYRGEMGRNLKGVTQDAMRRLQSYSYPGNVRELENIIERAVTLEPTEMITSDSLPDTVRQTSTSGPLAIPAIPPDGLDLDGVISTLERKLLAEALERSDGVRKHAAKLLGISFRSIRYRLKKHGIDDEQEELEDDI